MRNKTYSLGIKRIISGCTILICCCCVTSINALRDLFFGIIKHPILALIIIAAFAKMFVTTLKARAERDYYNEQAYVIQQRNNTLEIICSKQ